jgi:hypothetical protein
MLQEQDRLFQEKFGRPPGPDDPIFWDPDEAEPKPYTAEKMEELWSEIVQAAADAGIDPAAIYAMKKTGRILTEKSPATREQIEEWNQAIAEYYERQGHA